MKDLICDYLTDVGADIGVEFFLVGGAIRDELLGRPVGDWDAVARGLPFDALIEALRPYGRTEATGERFDVIRHAPTLRRGRGLPLFDIAIPRRERSTGPGTADVDAKYDPHMPIEEDLGRRDFTINSIALRCADRELIDPHGGRADLERGVLRMLHGKSAQDDSLRIIRGIRFMGKLGFTVEESTDIQLRKHVPLLVHVKKERFQKELLELLVSPHVDVALRYMQDIGALALLFPELERGVGCIQNHYHDLDVWEHTIAVVANTPSDNPYVRFAALLHDVAKPVVKWIGPDGVPHFYEPDDEAKATATLVPEEWGDHEAVGARIAYEILGRLRFSNHHQGRVSTLVREHMFPQGPGLGRKAARRFLARLEGTPGGIERNMEALFQIRFGDLKGGKSSKADPLELAQNLSFRETCRQELARDTAFKVTDLAVNGHDLMAAGLTGQDIGQAQKRLLQLVIDDPQLNEKDTLLALLREEP